MTTSPQPKEPQVIPGSESEQAVSVNQPLQTLRAILLANRQPVNRAEDNAHPRGWNDALDFVEKQIREMLGEKA